MAMVLILVGLALLIAGGESLVRGAAGLAAAARISPLVIGLTVVAFGTSAPEFAVTLQAAVLGQAELALGNVVGSNIFNVLFILGLSSLIVPLTVAAQLIWWDVPLMVVASVLLLLLGLDGTIGRWDGVPLLAGLVAYTAWAVFQSRRESRDVEDEYARQIAGATTAWKYAIVQLVWIAAGLALLALGSRWLVDGAVAVARFLGVSELIIGLTIVAAGTSLPETVTSVIAGLRGQRDIAVGNIVGSNLFNLLGVLAISAMVAPGGVPVAPEALHFDIPVMIATAVACLPIFFTGHVISRWEGALFLGYYAAYLAHLILAATQATAIRTFDQVMLFAVLPLSVVTLLVGVARAVRRRP